MKRRFAVSHAGVDFNAASSDSLAGEVGKKIKKRNAEVGYEEVAEIV
jgi:hypothetical protein